MTSCLQPGLAAAQRPRILAAPPAYSSASGQEAIELAESAGLILDPWQRFALHVALGETEKALWAAFEIAIIVARQNGKGGIIEARELAGLFLFGERLIIHSAHRFETSADAFLRMLNLIEGCPDLDRKVKRVIRSHGEEGIELRTGQRIKYKTRTGSGGRGLSGDLVILDEAMYLALAMMNALLFTMSARPNPQLWYTGSAVDVREHPDGEVLTRVRNRGLAGNDPSLAYLEWSPPVTIEQVDRGEIDLAAEALVEWSNPAVDIRISRQHVAKERRTSPRRGFAVERLSIGDWPDVSEVEHQLVDAKVLETTVDAGSTPIDPVAFGIATKPDRSRSAIGVGALRADGRIHGEVVDDRPGTSWVVPRLLQLIRKWDPCALVINKAGAASTVAVELAKHDIEPVTTTAAQFAQACGGFYDDLTQDRFRHRGDKALIAALQAVATKPFGGTSVWDYTASGYIAPAEAVMLARHGVLVHGRPRSVATPRSAGGQTPGTATSETADLARAGF